MSEARNKEPSEIEAPHLALRHCTVDVHARALIESGKLPFWWYQGTSLLLGNFSLPFIDDEGTWWYQVKPGLCWPVDFLRPLPDGHVSPPFRKSYMGFQHAVAASDQANSHLVINAILRLDSYGAPRIESKRRTTIRRGLRDCEIALLEAYDRETFAECRTAWNDLSRRTGWKRSLAQAEFDASWRLLLEIPGVSIIVGREKTSGAVAGFLITKIIGDTAYGDATATCTQMLETNVSSAMLYGFLENSSKLPGISKAHFAIKSNLTSLEGYKTSFGFEHHRFPARTELRPGIESVLKLLSRDRYNRMIGNI